MFILILLIKIFEKVSIWVIYEIYYSKFILWTIMCQKSCFMTMFNHIEKCIKYLKCSSLNIVLYQM